jgi:hypothetical protein
MPKGIARSAWVPELARSIGWKPQRLRHLFNSKGYFAPFGQDDAKGLKILEDANINTTKYRATKAAPAAPVGSSAAKKTAAKKKKEVNSTGAKISAAFRKKLVRRLARLLPQGDTAYGHQKVREILTRNGIKKPWDRDKNEAPALAIFQKEGIPIDKFEYATSAKGTALVPAPSALVAAAASSAPINDAAVVNPEAIVASYNELLAKHDDLARRHNDLLGRAKTSIEILQTYSRLLVKALYHREIPDWVDPMEYPITAMNILRGSRGATKRSGPSSSE